MQRLADAAAGRAAASRWIVSDDPDEHVERIRQYLDLGFRHLVFHAPGPRPGAIPAALRRAGAAPAQGAWHRRLTGRAGTPRRRVGNRSANSRRQARPDRTIGPVGPRL